jgi:pimeloyl-ACP methyl ester carboxylesterase
MGGMLASYIAVKYPVAKLVLLSTAAYYSSAACARAEGYCSPSIKRRARIKMNTISTIAEKLWRHRYRAVLLFMQVVKK